jgi:hypothetical protein
MRKDMFEIIIERPRYGSRAGDGKGRYASKLRADPDCLPLKEPMWVRGNTKCLNENLAPLLRFLDRRVGRPWSAVWSEIRQQISPRSVVQKHVYDHILQMVEQNPVLIDGIPHHPVAWGPRRDEYRPLTTNRWWRFYVCPRTGLLRSTAENKRLKLRKT